MHILCHFVCTNEKPRVPPQRLTIIRSSHSFISLPQIPSRNFQITFFVFWIVFLEGRSPAASSPKNYNFFIIKNADNIRSLKHSTKLMQETSEPSNCRRGKLSNIVFACFCLVWCFCSDEQTFNIFFVNQFSLVHSVCCRHVVTVFSSHSRIHTKPWHENFDRKKVRLIFQLQAYPSLCKSLFLFFPREIYIFMKRS